MKKKFLMSCMITFLGLGMTSCSNDDIVVTTEPEPTTPVAAGHYSPEGTSYISISAGGSETRSTLQDSESYLGFQWNAGDQLIVVEPAHGVIGTLTATSNSSMSTAEAAATTTFSGTVKGTLTDGDHLLFYYLGNKSVENGTKIVTCDFSTQEGTLKSAASLRYAATDSLTMKKNTETGVFSPKGGINLATKITVLKFAITYDETIGDVTSTYNASACTINGVTNKATIDLCAGTFTAGYTTNVLNTAEEMKSIRMSHSKSQASPYYYVAVPVFEDNTVFSDPNPNMTCTFFDASSTTKMQSWTSWTIGMGKWYAGSDGKGMAVTFTNNDTSYSLKSGYGGCDILGGSNNTDYSTKGGYSGNAVDGQVDDPVVDKSGYNGVDVHE